jgi:hypothetical protein
MANESSGRSLSGGLLPVVPPPLATTLKYVSIIGLKDEMAWSRPGLVIDGNQGVQAAPMALGEFVC